MGEPVLAGSVSVQIKIIGWISFKMYVLLPDVQAIRMLQHRHSAKK